MDRPTGRGVYRLGGRRGLSEYESDAQAEKTRRDEDVFFSTNTSSLRVAQYRANPNACVYFYHKGLVKYVGVMLTGKMEVLTDADAKQMIWRKGDTRFYQGGVTDPDYCVLRFTAERGRYYQDLKTESFVVE